MAICSLNGPQMYIKWVGEIPFGGKWQFYGISPWSPRCAYSSCVYFKLSALGMFQQVSICILKMSPAVNQRELVIHRNWKERWKDASWDISVMKHLRKRSGLSVFAFDHLSDWPYSSGLRASLGLGRLRCARPWNVRTLYQETPTQSTGLLFLSSVYPTPDFGIGDFSFPLLTT